jgi:CheY-like chemotaxis protein
MEKPNINLLIIDDQTDLALAIQESLLPKGYSVLKVDRADEALNLIETHEVDCLLCDFKMPVMNGIEFANKLRQKGLEVPIIMMTGYCENELLLDALRLGFFDFFEKPFDFLELKEALDKAIGSGISRRLLCGKLKERTQNSSEAESIDAWLKRNSHFRSLNYSKRTG